MKIAVLSDTFPPRSQGGADVIAFTLAKALQERGHEILVITTSRESKDAGVSTYEGMRVHTIVTAYDLRFQAYMSLWNVHAVREVTRILRAFNPDVVHAHNVHAYLSYRSLTVAKQLGARVVLTGHDVMPFSYQKLTHIVDAHTSAAPTIFNYRVSAWHQLLTERFRYNPLRNLVIRRVLRGSVDRIVTVSDALRDAFAQHGIQNAETIHNGIDAHAWEESAADVAAFKEAHGVSDTAILFGGRLSGVKGAVVIIDALARVAEHVPTVQLLIIGKREGYAEKMLGYARTRGVAERLVFTGWVSGHSWHQAYHAAAVVAVPSLCFDSFPTMNLEGMACTKPVIATCYGGSREAITDGIDGYIVNPVDVATLAEKLTDLLTNREKRHAFGEAGYRRVTTDFTVERQARAYERVFGVR